MRDLNEFDAIAAFENGDLRPLLDRVRSGAELSSDHRQMLAQVLEAAIAGRRGLRPPHRPSHPDWAVRTLARTMYFQFRLLREENVIPKVAIEKVAKTFGYSVGRVRQFFRMIGVSAR